MRSFLLLFSCAVLATAVESKVPSHQKDLALEKPYFMNASIAEYMGYRYNKALDFSAAWFGVDESVVLEINRMRIGKDTADAIIKDTILKMVYGGDYSGVPQQQISLFWMKIHVNLVKMDSSWRSRFKELGDEQTFLPTTHILKKRNIGQCLRPRPIAEANCVAFFYELTRDESKQHLNQFYTRYACQRHAHNRCCLSWLRDVEMSTLLVRDAWQTCRWGCFDKPSSSCEILYAHGSSGAAELSHVCFSIGPDGCIR